MPQHGFFIDLSRCIGCNTCVVSCKQWHHVPPGPAKWIRVYQWEEGTFPNVRVNILPAPCFHCEDPVCVRACPNGSLYKEGNYGAVLVDTDKCKGERKCWRACPYGAPQFEGDAQGLKMTKCNMCIDRLQEGLKPMCVLSCSMRALEFGPLEEMIKKYECFQYPDFLPKNSITKPAVVFKRQDAKNPIIGWDHDRALALWQKRQMHEGDPLPDVFAASSAMTHASKGIVGRDKLVLKAKGSASLMYYTMDDE